jgi:hypothetical protein
MISSKTFTIPTDQRLFAIVMSVITLGTAAAVVLAVAALVAAAYIVSLALQTVVTISHTIGTLYGSSDSLTQLLIIVLICAALWKIVKSQVRPSRKA